MDLQRRAYTGRERREASIPGRWLERPAIGMSGASRGASQARASFGCPADPPEALRKPSPFVGAKPSAQARRAAIRGAASSVNSEAICSALRAYGGLVARGRSPTCIGGTRCRSSSGRRIHRIGDGCRKLDGGERRRSRVPLPPPQRSRLFEDESLPSATFASGNDAAYSLTSGSGSSPPRALTPFVSKRALDPDGIPDRQVQPALGVTSGLRLARPAQRRFPRGRVQSVPPRQGGA
jgi:hypothetical protein